MSDTFRVDTEGLQNAVPGIVNLANQIRGITGQLQGTLQQAQDQGAIGTDAYSTQLKANYGPAAQTVLDALWNLPQALLDAATGVDTMAKGFAATEAKTNASIVTKNNGGSSPADTSAPGTGKP